MILFIFFFVDCCSIFNIDLTLFCYAFYYFICISMMYRYIYDCFSHIYTLSISSTIELYHHLSACKSVSLQASKPCSSSGHNSVFPIRPLLKTCSSDSRFWRLIPAKSSGFRLSNGLSLTCQPPSMFFYGFIIAAAFF